MADGLRLIAHRGVRRMPGAETPGYLENTIPSMRAAFAAGADVVEIDLQLTRDGDLAVFHDDRLENRTDGAGRVENHTMEALRQLDIGHRVSADGHDFPFRGTARGCMPSLGDVMEALPQGRFMLDLKRDDPTLGQAVARALNADPGWRNRIWGVYGGESAVAEVAKALPELRAFTHRSITRALAAWMLGGWTGRVPSPCRGATIYVPVNYARLLWGWPHRFTDRIQASDGTVVLIGPVRRGQADIPGIDTAGQAARVPQGWSGHVQTDRIETIGPLLRPSP